MSNNEDSFQSFLEEVSDGNGYQPSFSDEKSYLEYMKYFDCRLSSNSSSNSNSSNSNSSMMNDNIYTYQEYYQCYNGGTCIEETGMCQCVNGNGISQFVSHFYYLSCHQLKYEDIFDFITSIASIIPRLMILFYFLYHVMKRYDHDYGMKNYVTQWIHKPRLRSKAFFFVLLVLAIGLPLYIMMVLHVSSFQMLFMMMEKEKGAGKNNNIYEERMVNEENHIHLLLRVEMLSIMIENIMILYLCNMVLKIGGSAMYNDKEYYKCSLWGIQFCGLFLISFSIIFDILTEMGLISFVEVNRYFIFMGNDIIFNILNACFLFYAIRCIRHIYMKCSNGRLLMILKSVLIVLVQVILCFLLYIPLSLYNNHIIYGLIPPYHIENENNSIKMIFFLHLFLYWSIKEGLRIALLKYLMDFYFSDLLTNSTSINTGLVVKIQTTEQIIHSNLEEDENFYDETRSSLSSNFYKSHSHSSTINNCSSSSSTSSNKFKMKCSQSMKYGCCCNNNNTNTNNNCIGSTCCKGCLTTCYKSCCFFYFFNVEKLFPSLFRLPSDNFNSNLHDDPFYETGINLPIIT